MSLRTGYYTEFQWKCGYAGVCGCCLEMQLDIQPPQNPGIGRSTQMEHEKNLIQGLEFILWHSEDLHFPRTISTKTTEGRQIMVNNREEALARFKQANGLDCRIAAYPAYTDYYIKRTGFSPDFLFIDLDLEHFDQSRARTRLDRCLKKVVRNIRIKFNDSTIQPTELWTGGGYHIYLPIKAFVLEKQDVFSTYIKDNQCSRKFLQFAERFLSNDKADECHWKGVSFKNCMLRIPGSINSKNNETVKVIEPWNGIRPAINWLLRDYRRYLIQEVYVKPNIATHKRKRVNSVSSDNWFGYWRR